jgi:anti-sigma B factor antagonist
VPLTVVSEQGTAGIHIVRPASSLDSTASPILEDYLAGLCRAGATAFVLDLKDLTYISSAGVRVVLAAKKAMKAAGGRYLAGIQKKVREEGA